MRKLLNTLFVTSEDSYLALENENVLVLAEDERRGQFPLVMLESIVSFSYKGASPALMGACAKRGIQLSFFTPNGRFLARSCQIARNFIFGKVYNDRWMLERTLRDHALRVDAEGMKRVSVQLRDQLPAIAAAENLDSLRGLEGEASARYFSAFDVMILNQKEAFFFRERSRRPPLDNVNAVLSFAYTLLSNDCAAALEGVGLDSYVGFLHRDRPGRASLALDLMEELRGPLAERLALTLINTRELQPKHFQRQSGGAVLMTDDGRKLFLRAWQERKREIITHPYLKEKLPWGLVPHTQALLLARHLRGDLDGYPPFLWK